MFAEACKVAQRFTLPVVVSARRWDGTVETSAGAFIVLNDQGWVLTVAHLFQLGSQWDQDRPKIADVHARVAALRADSSLQPGYRDRQIKAVEQKADRLWITDISYWWGRDGLVLRDLTLVGEADLAVGRLDPFPGDLASGYPVFKLPTFNFDPGTSLCRLGFPFTDTKATFDSATGSFSLLVGQMVFFPVEGIFTRTLVGSANGRTADGKHPLLSVETSSPGLKGQSGGPVFDVHGRLWALQSRTDTLRLGFTPTITDERGRTTVEHQVINLGVGVHAATILSVLNDAGVGHSVSPD